MLTPGKILEARYQVKEMLEKDEYEDVYLGSHITLKKQIIIKEINGSFLTPEELAKITQTFNEKARDFARLDHLSIAKILDFFPQNDKFYLIMEYIDGQSLESAMETRKFPYEEREIIKYAIQLCRVIWFLHNQKPTPVVLGSLNAKNIIFRSDGSVSLSSLGIIKYIRWPSYVAKPGYTAPELYRNQISPRADIFSLGNIIYYLSTGINPSVSQHTNYGLPRISSINTEISSEMENIVKKASEVEASARFKSMKEMKESLEECLENLDFHPREIIKPSDEKTYETNKMKTPDGFKLRMEHAIKECIKDEKTNRITKAIESIQKYEDEPLYEINDINEDPFEKIARKRAQKAEELKLKQKVAYEAVDRAYKAREKEQKKDALKEMITNISNYFPFKRGM